MSALLYSLLCIAGDSASVFKRAPIVCTLFANISEMSCTSILAFDLTSCEAISPILLDVKVEYWYEKIDTPNTTVATTASITILVLLIRSLFSREDTFFLLTHPKTRNTNTCTDHFTSAIISSIRSMSLSFSIGICIRQLAGREENVSSE